MSTALGTAYGAYYGISTTTTNPLCLILDPATPEAGSLPATAAIIGAAGESVGLTIDGAAWSSIGTLSSTLSTGGAITSLPVAALAAGIASGVVIMTASGSSSQLWTVSGTVSVGATSIPVTSQTPNFAYPSGSAIGSTVVLDSNGQALVTSLLPALTAGTHTLAGLGSNSGTYDLTFPVKFNPLSTATDTNSPTAPTTTQQLKWRFFDPRVSVYTPNQVPRTNLATRPRCDSIAPTGQEWAFTSAITHGTYSNLTGQTTPLTGVTTALRKVASIQATLTSANLYGLTNASLMGTTRTALSTGAAITSIPVNALPVGFASGTVVTLTSGANTQNFTLSAVASVGATTLSVTSQTPNFAYPVGTQVAGFITAIPVSAMPVAFASGATLVLTSGVSTQTSITTSSTVSIGATSIPVSSFKPNFAFPSGTQVTGFITAIPVQATTAALSSGQKIALGTQIFSLSSAAGIGATSLPITAALPLTAFPSGTAVQTADATSFGVQLTSSNPDGSTTTAGSSPVINPGMAYTISFYARPTSAVVLTASVKYAFYDIAGALIGTATTASGPVLTSGSWTRVSLTVTAPRNAAMFGAYLVTGAPNVLDSIDVTGLLVEQSGILGAYFDGSSTANDTVYYWSGNQNLSSSVASPGYCQMVKNPSKWTSPNPTKTLTHASTPPLSGQVLAWESGKTITTFDFSGVITSQAEYLNLTAWAAKGSRFWLVDHRNIARLVMFAQLDIVPLGTPGNIWASSYTVRVIQYKANDGFTA